MGASASKAARTAAGAAQRQYPTRVPPASSPVTHSAPAPSRSIPPGLSASSAQTAPSEADPQAQGPRASATPVREHSTVDHDAFDPALAASLRQLGPVQMPPTAVPVPPTGTSDEGVRAPPVVASPRMNPALRVLEARERLAEQAEQEMAGLGKSGFEGRTFIDVMILRSALALRDDRGMDDAEIERVLELRPGTMRKLGPKGMVSDAAGGVSTTWV